MATDWRMGALLLLLVAAPAKSDPALDAVIQALPEGARETARIEDPPSAHGIAIGPAGPMAPPPERRQTGTRLRIAWAWPAGHADRIEATLADALAASGLRPVYTCTTDRCGGFDFRLALPVLPLPDMAVDLRDFRYMAAVRDDPPALAALLVSAGSAVTHAQLTLVKPAREAEPSPVPSPVPAPATAETAASNDFAERLDQTGRAVLEGLDFPPGGTALAEDSTGVLADLAAWLMADPARRVALVGHTDWSGTTETNLALSRARAAAVAAALEAMGANPAQATVAGVGPFAPRAANSDPDGLAANRRVEAVLLPPAR
jgi:OOP family OmpA-OmpF porin